MRIIMKENTNLEKLKAGLNTAFVDYANNMQVKFIENVMELYENGENRALLISSTGEHGIFVTGGRNPEFTRVSEAWS